MAVSFEQVRPVVQGRWLGVLTQLAPALSEAVEKHPRHVPCPVHGGQDGFRLYKNADETGGGICNSCGPYPDGFALLAWVNGWSLPDTLQAVANHLGVTEDGNKVNLPPKQTPTNYAARQEKAAQRKREALKSAWKGLIPLSEEKAEPARYYLTSRGLSSCLDSFPADLFYHPELEYWHEGKSYGNYPALVAVVRGADGVEVTLHRTYLDQAGNKADVPTVKKLMSPATPGSSRGGAIRLYPPAKELILAEGIETALALHLSLDKPCWACVSAGGLEAVSVPEQVKRVIIGADNDANGAGQKAAYELVNRLIKEDRQIEVKVIIPDHVGTDWLDVFNGEEKTA